MARKNEELSARGVQTLRKPGYHIDGKGLYLQISAAGTKSWVFRYMLRGKSREMGLGRYPDVPLASQDHPTLKGKKIDGARELALACRLLLKDGIDPIEERKAAISRHVVELATSKTFRECAEAYIASHRSGWKNAKHVGQWENTLQTYAYPKIGVLPVRAIETGGVQEVLQAIWSTKRETAVRLRGRIEKILDWATVLGYRSGPNPAAWRGHLDKLLAKDQRRRRITHHPAMQVDQVGGFMVELCKQEGTAAKALEFLILTAARTGEVIGATWEEIDLQGAVWTIPAARMKVHQEHRVPLSPRAVRLLEGLDSSGKGGFVFPGRNQIAALSNMAMLKLLDRKGYGELTVHGFRSTFRDWAAERTNFPREVAEAALAHTVTNDTEAAYRRGDLFDKRRRLMDEWTAFCGQQGSADVIPIRKNA